jgi:hydrogenase maturation protein HypF
MENSTVARWHIQVTGVVQGVGFRPFVYTLAEKFKLAGFVFNSSAGVTIEVEGAAAALEKFAVELREHPPALASIRDIRVTEVEASGETTFHILHSREEAGAFALIPADAGTCEACRRDFGDPANRRYGYPFTNCTHCGPRYTIIRGVPYDRPATTMANFKMCAECAAEYADPMDRRFHAQPNACAVCGPSLCLVASGAKGDDCAFTDTNALPILQQVRSWLQKGKIVAVKGLGGFQLACDARNPEAIAELRRRKRRPAKPFALMARDIPAVRALCEVSAEEEAALVHPRRPILVLRKRADAELPEQIAPGNLTVGVMLPATPLHSLLFCDSPNDASEFDALVMTSGNFSEEPIVIGNEEALEKLAAIADYFLLHNRDIATRVDDSVARVFLGKERVLRRSRGYAPQTIDLGSEMEEVLAYGAELKSTFCLTKGSHAILSQHLGDLENYETMRFFEETLAQMQTVFRVTPKAVAHDLHPTYRSTRMALASPVARKIAVQHHHAHIASCMAENHLRGKVIGVALDGTGYGTDGKIWGGEFLLADFAGFERRAHFRYVALPGGDAAVRQPWRMALSYLRDAFGADLPDVACLRDVPAKTLALVDRMIATGLQTVETSSCGRLFDAVAALVGPANEVSFEGEAAIALENCAAADVEERYEYRIEEGDPMVLDFRPMIAAIVADLARGIAPPTISARFHNAISDAIIEICSRIRERDGITRVCVSGGTFQNVYLSERVVEGLAGRGFGVFLHSLAPPNDGGIALGQAVIANELLRREG